MENVSPSKLNKNGMAFDIILDNPNPKCKTPSKLTNTPNKQLTNEDIKNKLVKAEERRQSMEIIKLANVTEKSQKIEEAAKIREEININFQKKAEAKLNQKMELNKENRTTLMNTLMEKLKKTDAKINEIKESESKTTKELRDKIDTKLANADESRKEYLNSLTERLKEHESHVEEVKSATMSNNRELEEKILTKLEKALNNREEQLESMKQKIKDQQKHADEVRKEKALRNQTNQTECA